MGLVYLIISIDRCNEGIMNIVIASLLLKSPSMMDKWWEKLTAEEKLAVMQAAAILGLKVPMYSNV